MTNSVLELREVSKCFPIGTVESREETLLHQVLSSGGQLLRRLRQGGSSRTRAASLHWALRDISFSVAEGQVVSVIGHNGSGKSTLLKILSRITAPTAGEVRVRGRLASLLEVGTGFHPDLSGRDNVYLNAAILGMKREEIRRRFDDIVDFSGVSAFIDTPVKNYSSGMKVRLGFAVAAHLDPDVLLIDEVLAVGDAAFQRRCLQRIESISGSGRTVMFVSHQMASVMRLCQRTIVLDHGRIAFDGPVNEGVRYYHAQQEGLQACKEWSAEDAPADHAARLLAMRLSVDGAPVVGAVAIGSPIDIELDYDVLVSGRQMTACVHVFDSGGTWVSALIDLDPDWRGREKPPGRYRTRTTIPAHFLADGYFTLGASLANIEPYQPSVFVSDVVSLTIYDAMDGSSARGDWKADMPGFVRPKLAWKTEPYDG